MAHDAQDDPGWDGCPRCVGEVVEGAPKTLKEGATKDEAADIKKKFEEVGAKIEVK